VFPLTAAAQSTAQGSQSDSNERFGQMKTPEGHEQAGDSTGSMAGKNSDRAQAWRGQGWDDMSADEEDDTDQNRQSVSHDDHGWDRGRGDRWHSWSRDDRDGNVRQDEMRNRMRERMQGRGMGPGMGMGAMMGMRPPMGALFNVQVGDARVTVRCAVREETSACVDAAVSLVNRLRQGASASAPSGLPSPSANPAPAPSTPKPTTP